MWWVFILKKIRIVAFLFFVFCFFLGGGGGREGEGGSPPSKNLFNSFTP